MTKEHRRLIIEKCSNPEVNQNPTMPLLPYMPVEDNASRHRNLIERAARECIYQPHLSALTMLMNTAEWKREILYTMGEGLIKARKGNSRIDKGLLDNGKFRILRDFTRNSDGVLDETDLEENAPMVHHFLQITMEEHGITHVAFQEMVEQELHCDPKQKHATTKRNERSCHVLVSLLGPHCFALSTSPKIPTMEDRYREWSGGGCAAVKVKPKNCRDILLIARQDKTAFQAIHNTLLAGIINCDEFEQCLVLHAGVPGTPLGSTSMPLGSEETEVGWVSSQELHQFQQDRNREFREEGGVGVDTSVTMICDYYGTRSESARAFDTAAERVLQSYNGNLDEAPNVWSRRHMSDLVYHKKLLQSGQLCNLSFKPDEFWSEDRIEEHYRLCVEKGGCERGCMVGTKLDEHCQLSVDGGGCEAGSMVSTKRDEHRKKCTKGDAVTHSAKVVVGWEDKNALLLQLANGKLNQGHEWTESKSCDKDGSGVKYTFTNKNGGVQIEGKRNFEEYLLTSYMLEELTQDGKLVYAAMKKKREEMNKRNAKNAKRKQRAN